MSDKFGPIDDQEFGSAGLPGNDADPLVDSLLEEFFGGVRPPDVSARVLARLHAANFSASGNGHAANTPIPLGTAVASKPRVVTRRPVRRNQWVAPAVSAAIGGVACSLIVWALTSKSANEERPVAQKPSSRGSVGDANVAVKDKPPEKTVELPPKSHANPAAPEAGAIVKSGDPPPIAPEPADAGSALPDASAIVAAPVVSDAEMVALIDRVIRQRWSVAAVTPSAAATDAEWLRRLYLAVIGRIPTLSEYERFHADDVKGRRAAAVERLLASNEYAEEFARNWTNVYTVALVGHMAGAMPDESTDRGGLQQYLRRAFLENQPLDAIASGLLTATGSTRPGDEDYNGATNFLVDKLDDGGVQAAVKCAQVFLGVQIQCTQCHNHPFNDWKQGRFWELASFFRQANVTKAVAAADGGQAPARIADRDFAGEGGTSVPADGDAEVYYEDRSGRLKAAYPVFLDGREIARSGNVADVNRRRELARLVTTSPYFADAIVNRVWSHFFGQGFTRQVDDMGPHNAPSHPELLGGLSRQLATRKYDLKSLIRWIALSEPYALSSRPSRDNIHDDPAAGSEPLFSRYYLRQMSGEQLYESLVALASEKPGAGGAGYEERERAKTAWMRQFVIAYRTDECDECSLLIGSIPQTLSMMNGELVMAAADSEAAGALGRIVRSGGSDARRVQQLFLMALGRNPSPAEQSAARRMLATPGATAADVLEDLWWAVLNSNEFILDR